MGEPDYDFLESLKTFDQAHSLSSKLLLDSPAPEAFDTSISSQAEMTIARDVAEDIAEAEKIARMDSITEIDAQIERISDDINIRETQRPQDIMDVKQADKEISMTLHDKEIYDMALRCGLGNLL